MVAIELKPEHGYVLVCAGALAFESLALGGAVGAARAKAFGKEWRDRPAVKALAEEHKKAFPNRKFADGGYPDMGSGRYCDLLTYEEWVHFNNAQRGHQNMLEALPAALVSLGAAGVLYPLTASVLGAVFGVGRILYAAGYRRSGPAGRVFGVALADVGLLGLIGCSIRAGLKIAGVA